MKELSDISGVRPPHSSWVAAGQRVVVSGAVAHGGCNVGGGGEEERRGERELSDRRCRPCAAGILNKVLTYFP